MQATQLVEVLGKVVQAAETRIDQSADGRSADANTIELWTAVHFTPLLT